MLIRNTVLRQNSPQAIVESVRLSVNNPIGDSKIIILVEGDDDERAYSHFFDKEKTLFLPIGNCEKVKESMEIITIDSQLSSCVIGIKDADFDHIAGRTYEQIPLLFLTDTHDVETLMLTDNVIRSICNETRCTTTEDIKTLAINNIIIFSFIRYYNDEVIVRGKKGEGLNFKNLKLPDYDLKKPEKDKTFWLNKVKSHAGNKLKKSFPSEYDFDNFVTKHTISPTDYMKFVNGHDLVSSLCRVIHAIEPKTSSYGEDKIAMIMRTAYTIDEFSKTNIYKGIDSWARNNGINIWQAS